MSQNTRHGQGQNNARRGTASNSTNFRGGRGGWQPGNSGTTSRAPNQRLSNNGQSLVGRPDAGPARTPQVKFVAGMKIITPNLSGKTAWDTAENQPAMPTYSDGGAHTLADPEVIWACQFGSQGRTMPGDLSQINFVAKNEARALGFPCVIIRKEPHDRQYERTALGHQTTTINLYTGKAQRTMIDADLHLTVYMGNSLKRVHIHGHIYLERHPSDVGSVATKVRKLTNPQLRKYVPPGENPVSSEYWLMSGVQALGLDNKVVKG